MCLRTWIQRRIKRWRGLRQAARLLRTVDPIRLDLGCGATRRSGFVGIDWRDPADISWDLRWGIPLGDSTVTEIRSDHFLEHLELPMVVATLCECRRVLRSGGLLDFSVPHIDLYLDAYLRHDVDFLREKICDIPQGQEELYSTRFDRIVWLLYRNGEHQSLFDRESILAKVKLAGFKNVTTREFDPDRDTNPRFSSIYVVARK